jgi:hypothetical protein
VRRRAVLGALFSRRDADGLRQPRCIGLSSGSAGARLVRRPALDRGGADHRDGAALSWACFRIGLLNRQWRSENGRHEATSGLGGAYLIGLAFAFGWTPCVGPILAAILFTASGTDTAGQGAMLLTSYGIGMTLPFVLAALSSGRSWRFMARFRRHLGAVEKVTGAALVVFGLLIATNAMNYIGQWMLENFEVFQTIG